MTRLMTTAALACVLGLGACWEMTSDVAVVVDETRLAGPPRLQPGVYCSVGAEYDDANAVESVDVEDCFPVQVQPGAILVPTEEGSDELTELAVADLSRGAYLLHWYAPDDDQYMMVVTVMRDEGLAVLPELEVTPYVLELAEAANVVLDVDDDDDLENDPPDLRILSGEPEAALGLIRDATGLRFDAGLRDAELGDELMTEGLYYVRVAPDIPGVVIDTDEVDEDAVREQVEQVEELRGAIMRAMTLE